MTSSRPLEIQGLFKTFDHITAVAGIDLTLEPGELLALVGPSGCGKSTVLRSIAGLIKPDAGTIRMAGRTVDDGAVRLPPERRSVGLVFQEHALFPHLTVKANVEFGVRDLSKSDTSSRVQEMMDLVSLTGYGDRYPHELSGGERQRVALARALAPRPALMLFDEPFASLDHNLRVKLRHEVVSALRATQTPAVFVTHHQQEALAFGDRIAVMKQGHIVQLGTPREVFHNPRDAFVASFMGHASFLPIASIDGVATSALGKVDMGDMNPRTCVAMVRPSDIVFQCDDNGNASVVGVEYHGTEWLVSTQLGDGTEVMASQADQDPPLLGQRGVLRIAERCHQIIVAKTS